MEETVIHGEGAWYTYYYLKTPRMGDQKLAVTTAQRMTCWAILSLKKELVYCNSDKDIVLNTFFGSGIRDSVRAFQKANQLEVDGIVGPLTAKALYGYRIRDLQKGHQIPNQWLCRIISVESDFDPGAIGFADPLDYGLAQEHAPYNPGVSLAQAADGQWALEYAADRLGGAFSRLQDWEATAVSYNIGLGGATSWLAAGKPTIGGTTADPDLYERAAIYLALLSKQTC